MTGYLAIDIGTNSAKAAIYQEDGRLATSAQVDYPVDFPAPGWAEQDPQTWWQAVQQLCGRVLAQAGNPGIACIAVSGQAPSCVPLDRDGSPLRPAILWLDRRAQPQAPWLVEQVGVEAAARVSGNKIDSYYGGLKWLWFLQNEPELYARTWKIAQANGYIVYRLTGVMATDPSQAGMCSPCFDLKQQVWSREICQKMGLDLEKLPDIYPSFAVVGQVTAQAAQATGLKAGTPVVCGGGDFACSCVGAGVVRKGSAAMMLGTSGNLLVPAMPALDDRLINTVHLTGEGLSMGGVYAGGSVKWFADLLKDPAPNLFSALDQEALSTPPGADGLVFLPYLMGGRTPIWDDQARGVFIGLSNFHQRGHLFRAVLEGVAYAYRQIQDILTERGMQLDEVIAIDGGARSALWRQIFADVMGLPIRWRPASGGTLLGAAYLAASGDPANHGSVDLASWLGPTVDILPDRENAKRYQSRYAVYSQLYDRLKDCFVSLTQE